MGRNSHSTPTISSWIPRCARNDSWSALESGGFQDFSMWSFLWQRCFHSEMCIREDAALSVLFDRRRFTEGSHHFVQTSKSSFSYHLQWFMQNVVCDNVFWLSNSNTILSIRHIDFLSGNCASGMHQYLFSVDSVFHQILNGYKIIRNSTVDFWS